MNYLRKTLQMSPVEPRSRPNSLQDLILACRAPVQQNHLFQAIPNYLLQGSALLATLMHPDRKFWPEIFNANS